MWLLGKLLTRLSDHRSNVFVVGTTNNVSKLPPEFLRADRLDAMFFANLPSHSESSDGTFDTRLRRSVGARVNIQELNEDRWCIDGMFVQTTRCAAGANAP